uniref:RGS domain-containing protein n=1 Tax=Romanomermis culicivorax TaxID=13658 RepID=A0A915IS49_ROMCU
MSKKNVKSRKYPSSEASTSRLTVDSEGGDRLKKSSTASMKKKRSFADPIAKKLSFLRRRPTDVNLLQLARPGADERPSERDVRSWAECFDRLLQSSGKKCRFIKLIYPLYFFARSLEGLKYFRLFLQREFSDENIEFWLACDHYKRIDDPQIRRKRSASIFKEFVAFQAPKEVNLDSSSRTATIELLNVKPDSVEVFDTAQYRIQSLMAKDSYPRFLRSDIYLNLITHARMAEQ